MNFWDEYEDPTCSLTEKLKDGNSTWDAIILDEHCLEKMRDEDKLLLEFLTKSETLSQLVHGALEPVIDVDLPETKQYKLAHRCTEVLCFRLNVFYDAIFANTEIMTFLANYLETHKQSLNSLIISFYCKILLQLYQYRTMDMIAVLKTSNFLDASFDCMAYGAVYELLVNLTAKVFPDDREPVKKWLIDADFGLKMFSSIEKFENDFIALENIGFLWSEYVKALRDYCYSIDASDELLDNVQRPELIAKLLPMMFKDQEEQNWSFINCGCLILMGYFESTFEGTQPSMDITRTLVEHGRNFNPDVEHQIERLCADYLSNFLQTAYDAWLANDGEVMIACLTLLECILNTPQAANHQKFVEELRKFGFEKWLTGLASNPTSTIAVNCLYNIIGYILHCAPSEENYLLNYLFNEVKIVPMILDFVKNEPSNLSYVQRKAFKSYLYRLAERLEQAKRLSQNFMVIRKCLALSDNVQEWDDFVENQLKIYLEDNIPDDSLANQTISDISGQDLYVDEMMDDEDELKESDAKNATILSNDDLNKVLEALQKTDYTDRPKVDEDEVDCEPDDFNLEADPHNDSTVDLDTTAELLEKLHADNAKLNSAELPDGDWPTTNSEQQFEWPAFSPIKKYNPNEAKKEKGEIVLDWPTNLSVKSSNTETTVEDNDDWPSTSDTTVKKPEMNLFDVLKKE